MRTEHIHIYTLAELKELDNAAYQKAMDHIRYRRQEDTMELDVPDMLDTMKSAARHFSMRVTDWSIGFSSHNYVAINTDNYFELDNQRKNELVAWLNANTKEGKDGSCPFTGVVYDCYFFDEIASLSEPVTYNTLHNVVPEALNRALIRMINAEEEDTWDQASNEAYAADQGLEFYRHGKLYHG